MQWQAMRPSIVIHPASEGDSHSLYLQASVHANKMPCSATNGLFPCACSGMLPGYVSGFYSMDECHVDLNRLARHAQARLIVQPATGLDIQVLPATNMETPHATCQHRSFQGCRQISPASRDGYALV